MNIFQCIACAAVTGGALACVYTGAQMILASFARRKPRYDSHALRRLRGDYR